MIGVLVLSAALAAGGPAKLALSGGGLLELSGVKKATWVIPKHHLDYTGSPVRVVLRDMLLTCNKLGLQLDDADQQVLISTCEGDVHMKRGERTLTCEKATFDDPKSLFTCEGKPVMTSGAIRLECETLVYDLAKDQVDMSECQGKAPGDVVDKNLQRYEERRKPKEPGGGK